MNEKIKRITGRYILPSLLIMLSLCILFVPAAGSDKADGAEIDTYFMYEGNQYKITGETTVWFDKYYGSSDSFTMPDTVQYEGVTYYVTELNGAAFKDNSNTPKEIVTSKYLTTIQNMSFQNSPLEKITLYGQLESIGANAFNGSNLTTVVLAEYVDSIQVGANTFKSKNGVVFEYGKRDFSSQPLLAKITVCSDESLQSPITNISNEEYNSLTNVYFDWEYRYRVDHYVMKNNGVTENMYTECEYFFGKGWTAAAPKVYEGRTELPFSQEIISEDGNTKVKIYYVLDVESLELPDDIVTEYVAGDTFKEFNLIVKHKSDYDGNSDGNPDGITTTVKVTSSMLSGFSTLKSGQYEATVTYAGMNVRFTYTVSEKTLDLWVGGTQITSENNVLSDGNGGTATYDISKNTLTLNDFDINTEGIGIQSTMTKRIFLVIKGENNIVSGQNGIEAHLLSIDGNGTLNIKSEAAAIFVVGISDHTYIRGSSQTDGLKINIESESHGVYQKFSEGNGSDRSMSIVFRYCDIVMSGSGSYGIHGGYGTYLESCTVSIIGYTTGIYSGGATAQGTHLGIEDSSLYIECSVGFDGYHCDPVFTNSVIDVVCNKGFDVVYWGTITLDGSDLSICYRMYASTSSPDFDLYNDSSLVMGFDHERDSISYNDRLCEGSLKINIHDPEDGTYQYVVSVGKSSDAMALYSRAEFDDMLLSSGNYDSSNTKPSETLIYLTSGNMPYYFELRPMATIFYCQDLSTIYSEAYSYKGGTVTTPTSSDITVPVGNELYGWMELSGEFYLPGRTITVTEAYMALLAIFEPPTPVGISVIGDSMISIGDTLEDTSLMVRISYDGNVFTDLHITDVLFEVVGFVTSSYVSEDEPLKATVTYGNLSCEFQYSVRKIPQSLSEFYLYDVSLTGPDDEYNFTDGYNDETSHFYFGSGDGELSVTITDRGDAEFDYDEETMTISNVTKAGTITLLFTRGADDTYMETSAEYQMTIYKADVKYYLEEYIVLDPVSPDVDDSVTVGLFNDDDATVTIEVVEGGTATATVDGNTVSISDRGADGTVVIKVSVSGSPYYRDSSGTCTLTFSKASGDSEDGFVLPNGLVASKGQTTEDVILPEGWAWTESVTFNRSGDVSVSATYTPANPNNYEVYSTELTVSVGKTPSSITLSDTEFVYADGLTIHFYEYVGGDGDGTLTYSVGEKTGVEFNFEDGVVSNISVAGGSFELIVTKSSTEEFAAKTETFVITLDKGVQSIVVSGGSQSLTFLEPYGVTVTGNVGGLTYAVIEGDATFTDNVLTATGAGTVRYTVTASETDLFDSRTEERAVTFSKVDLTVSVDGCSIEYGSEMPRFTVSQTGLIEGHVLEDIVGELSFTCKYQQYDDVGPYDIAVLGNESNENYNISYKKGVLTVSPKEITVTIGPSISEYGAEPVQLTATADGIVNGDSDVFILSTEVTSESPVGRYDVIGTVVDDNYFVTFLNGDNAYSVVKATVEIPIVEDVEYTGQHLSADIVSNNLYNVISNNGGTQRGTYTVQLELKDQANYAWAEHEGVNNAQVTLSYQIVTAINSWKVQPNIEGWTYGQASNKPIYEATYGNSTAVIEYRSLNSTDEGYSIEVPSNAGTYLMRVTVEGTEDYGGLSSTEIEFTIKKADYVPTPTPFFSSTYGVSQNDLIFTGYDGWSWINPSSEVLNAGTHTLSAKYTPSDLSNYNVLEAELNVVISKKNLTVTVSDLTIEYGLVPEFTLSYTGFINGENESVLNLTELSWSGYSEADGTGTYEITADGIDSPNYHINVVAGTLQVNEATPTYQNPTPKEGLTYSGKEQKLIAGGTVENGTMEYSLDGTSWSEEIPTGKEVDEYTVYFRVIGYENYKDLSELEPIKVEISPCPHDYVHSCDADCSLCGAAREIYHNFDGEWQFDEEGHWCECLTEGCDAHNEKVEHISSGSATEDVAETCTVCGYIIAPALGHECVPVLDEMLHDEHTHWYGCTGCEERVNESVHDFDNDCDPECNTCTYEREITHSYTDLEHDSQGHWYECECGDGTEPEAHSGGTATCEDRAICSTCGQQYGELAAHSYDNACDPSCNVCGSSRSVGSHQYGSDNTCDECGHVRYVAPVTPSVPSHTHHYSDACDTTCNGCSHVRTVSHTFGTEWTHGDHHHWMECEDCGYQSQLAEHVYSTDVEDTQCNVCGHDWKIHHTFEVLHMDDEGHWHECAHDECTETANFMEHIPSDPHPETGTIVCIDCGHDLTNVSSSVDDGDGGNNMAVIIAAVVGVIAVFGVGAFFLLRGKP